MANNWPFDDSPDTLSRADPEIFDGTAWVFLVQRQKDGTWLFRQVDHLSVDDAQLVKVSLKQVLELEPSVCDLADLPRGWNAWRQNRDAPWERAPQPSEATYFIQFETTPSNEHPNESDTAGAFVNCWVRASEVQCAIETARDEITADGWIVGDPDEVRLIQESDFVNDPSNRSYFDQAQIDGMAFVYYRYPLSEHKEL